MQIGNRQVPTVHRNTSRGRGNTASGGAPLTDGDFADGLTGWDTTILAGGSSGNVHVENEKAVLLEGNSFLVTLLQTFTVDAPLASLSFDIFFDPGFDRSDNFIPDAFEVSLLDSSSHSVVPTWNALATSFINFQEDFDDQGDLIAQMDNSWFAGPGVTFDGKTVAVDLSSMAVGTMVTLYFDLIGADADHGSGVSIDNVSAALRNHPPVCNAGGPYPVECAGTTTKVHLDGSESSDPDNDALIYSWSSDCPGSSFDDASSETPVLTVGNDSACFLSCHATLTLSDGIDSVTCDAEVSINDTTPPVVACPPDITVECDGEGNRADLAAWLAATAYDACGSVVLENDFFGLIDNPDKSRSATVTWTATDDCTLASTCSATFTIVDTHAATIHISDMILLWPPNHQYMMFSLTDCATATDGCTGAVDVTTAGEIVSIYSDEPEDAKGTGDGATLDDIVILGPSSFALRAERDGGSGQRGSYGNGRVYGVQFEVTDTAGNVATGLCRFSVPHDQSCPTPVDDGAAAGYTVTAAHSVNTAGAARPQFRAGR